MQCNSRTKSICEECDVIKYANNILLYMITIIYFYCRIYKGTIYRMKIYLIDFYIKHLKWNNKYTRNHIFSIWFYPNRSLFGVPFPIIYVFLVSRRETLGFTLVCPSIRTSVRSSRRFLRNRALELSNFWHEASMG